MNNLCNKILNLRLLNGYLSNNSSKCGHWGMVSTRNTFILKRRIPPKLAKKGVDPAAYRPMKPKNYEYELVEFTESKKKPEVEVILKTFVEGLGVAGDLVKVKRNIAYNKLLLTGLADYPTPETVARAEKQKKETSGTAASSRYAPMTAKYLQKKLLSIVMNKETPWTIQPWHVSMSFRKSGIHVPEHCIKLPDRVISGPDLNLEQKDFPVEVTINGKEKVIVRCRLHHWISDPSERLPFVEEFWKLEPCPMYDEFADSLNQAPPYFQIDEFKEKQIQGK